MSSSPTPSEREKKDKEDRAREAEEQAKLPYKWTQTISDLDITIGVASNLRGKDIVVDMTKSKLKVGVKGQEPFIDVCAPTNSVVPLLSQNPPPLLTHACMHLHKLKPRADLFRPSPTPGPPPPRDPPLGIHLDARAHRLGQGHLHPPRQDQQAAVVGLGRHQRPVLPGHGQDPAREQQAGRLGRRDEGHGREDDV